MAHGLAWAPGALAGRSPNKLKPSEYFGRNFAITTSGVEDPLALRYCIDKIGVDNVMWAIDYPYQPTAPAVQWIHSRRSTDAEREKICHGNAERMFHIAPGLEPLSRRSRTSRTPKMRGM